MARATSRHRILNAIDRLQAKSPAEGEGVHWSSGWIGELGPLPRRAIYFDLSLAVRK
jgi:hypothetical protein